jgi:surface antigen
MLKIAARALFVLPALALAACATTPTVSTIGMNPTDTTAASAPSDPTVLQAPVQTISTAAATTDASAFVDAGAYGMLSAKSKAEVAGAQFNALQFGRVGAPRAWQGDNGQSGNVMVGPYVRVNLIDCRDFTNTVMIGGQSYVKKGTACRETDGSWTVSATKAG